MENVCLPREYSFLFLFFFACCWVLETRTLTGQKSDAGADTKVDPQKRKRVLPCYMRARPVKSHSGKHTQRTAGGTTKILPLGC